MLAVINKHPTMKLNLIVIFVFLSILSAFCQVGQFEKFELPVSTSKEYVNPYDYDEVIIRGEFISPVGESYKVDGFYIDDYELNPQNGGLTPLDEGFKIRFAPNLIGNWSYTISIEDADGISEVDSGTFQCTSSNQPNNRGFVRKNDSNYLNFDDGHQYILIGENMAWPQGNAVTNYTSWLSGLADFGGNFIRLWHAHWGLGIEWKNGWSGFEGLRKYHQIKSRYQDWLYDYCADNGIYVMLCIQHHGQVSSQVNPNWADSPYNISNGGTCNNTWDFFTNEAAIAHTKNRLRYIVARWGYSKNIMAWELFNEVEWTDNFSSHKDDIAEWHFEMASYLKSIDPYGHIVTTSYAHDDEDPLVWSSSEMDITQTHFYNNVPNIERILAGGVRRYLNEFQKPTLTGEFGLGGSSQLAQVDADGIHLHNSLWGALMSGGMGTGMTWWWDSYVHPMELYYHFDGVSQFSNKVLFKDQKLAPSSSYVSGAVGDLTLTPSSGWGSSASDSIRINELGQITPTDYTLGQFLYGSQWNTQFRSPPSFYVNFSNDGFFRVTTSSSSGQDPQIAIWLDSEQVLLETNATTDTSYEIPVPAGEHVIKVDNTGTDWITISGYSFSNLGSAVDHYVLSSEDKNYSAGWVLNAAYNHQNVNSNGVPDPINGSLLNIPDLNPDNYVLRWYDCLTGDLLSEETLEHNDSILTISIPEFYWDAAFLLQTADLVSVSDIPQQSKGFQVYPNPIKGGELITISEIETMENVASISLINISGQKIQDYSVNSTMIKSQDQLQFSLPSNIVSGTYWVSLRYQSGKVSVRPIMIFGNR